MINDDDLTSTANESNDMVDPLYINFKVGALESLAPSNGRVDIFPFTRWQHFCYSSTISMLYQKNQLKWLCGLEDNALDSEARGLGFKPLISQFFSNFFTIFFFN